MAKLYRNKCKQCGRDYVGRGRERCSRECSQAWIAQKLGQWNRTEGARRMLANPPMAKPGVREKMMATRRRNPETWVPGRKRDGTIVPSGNGRGPTPAQRNLATALGLPMEVVVGMGQWRRGRAKNYKLDIANRSILLGIEIDGWGHDSAKGRALDKKKTEALAGLGWTVLRFSNEQVMEHLEECVEVVRSTTSRLRERTSTWPTGS